MREADGCGSVDAANGVSFFPDPTRARLAVTSGQRHYDLPPDMLDDEDDDGLEPVSKDLQVLERRNQLQIYEFSGDGQEVSTQH